LRNSRALENLRERLQSIQSLTQFVADQVVLTRKDIKTFGEIVTSLKQDAKSSKLQRQEMPSKPAIFYGRDELVKKFSKLVSSEALSHICLLGPGGMGKTSLALAIVESPLVQAKFPEERCVWVPCVEATTGALFLQVLYSSLRVKRQTDSTLSDILFELKLSQEPILLFLDNFETPWNTTDDQDQVENALRKLNRLSHVSILITMRGSDSPSFDVVWHSEIIHATDMDSCRRICEQINPNWNTDCDVDDLLVAVGCMPFAVTLMATRGRQSKSSAKQLLDEWAKLGTDMLSPDGSLETGMNKSICLSVDSHFVKSDPDALYLLATLSLLPAGTTRDRLEYWAPNLKSTSGAIATLLQAALLQTPTHNFNAPGSQTLFILPVIQSFMRHHDRIHRDIQQHVGLACCKYVLDHASRYYDPNFKANSEALAREETNIQSILIGTVELPDSDDQLVRALLAFAWYGVDTKPVVAIAVHTLNQAKATNNDRYVAEALMCLANVYSKVDRDDEAKPLLEESSQLFHNLAHDHSARQLGIQCDLLRVYVYGFVPGPTYDDQLTIIMDVLARTKDSDEYWHARALSSLGQLYWCYQEYEGALEALDTAKDIFLRLGCVKDASIALRRKADTLNVMPSTSDELVLEAVQNAWEEVKFLDPSDIHGSIHLRLGEVLLRMNKLSDAVHYFEKSLGAYQRIGSILGAADAFASIGHAYLHTGAYSDAYHAYEAAVEKYATLGESVYAGREFVQRFNSNMERIRLMQENPNEKLGFYRPRTDREEGLFFPSAYQVDLGIEPVSL